MDTRAREICRIGDGLFGAKREIDSLWQELANAFYPERADFTETRSEGDEYSDHLFSSYPVLARRELGNLLSANLRPQSTKWFSMHVDDMDLDERDEERTYLEYLTDIQWRAMYRAGSRFVRATKEGDHDYAAFGNAVLWVGLNEAGNGLLYRCHHLRDCAWMENSDGLIDAVWRRWEPKAWQLFQMFPDKVSTDVRKMKEKDPNKPVKCKHIVVPSRLYHTDSEKQFPYWSLYVETQTETVLEERGMNYNPYVIPRWQTVSGSAYGRSMATCVGLPDGRTMQVVMRTLREAGERYVDPPLVAVADAIRGDIPTYPGGITIADIDYDERLGEVLRPLTQDKSGYPIGEQVAVALREDLRAAFFLDKIQLPDVGNADMTAFEVRRRIEEHIRGASPLFEPVEKDYNAVLCERTFDCMADAGLMPLGDVPEGLQGADVRYTFRSPLADAADQGKAATFVDGLTRILMPAAQIDPNLIETVNMTESLRDALKAAGWQQEWFNPIEQVEEARQKFRMLQEAAGQAALVERGGAAAKSAGEGGQEVQRALAGPTEG